MQEKIKCLIKLSKFINILITTCISICFTQKPKYAMQETIKCINKSLEPVNILNYQMLKHGCYDYNRYLL